MFACVGNTDATAVRLGRGVVEEAPYRLGKDAPWQDDVPELQQTLR